jgi:hypothetical protein
VAKNPLIISTFIGISPGGRMNLGREHRAEKPGSFMLSAAPTKSLTAFPLFIIDQRVQDTLSPLDSL